MLSAAPLELRQRSYESFAQILGNSSERDNPLAKLIQLANKEISSERASSWVDVFSNLEFTIDSMLELIDSLADILGSPLLAWAFLLEWVTTSTNFEKKLSRKSLRHIRLLTSKIDDASQAAATEKLATASREKFNDFKTDVGGVDDYEIPAFLRKQAD